MARTADTATTYKVKIHTNKGYSYFDIKLNKESRVIEDFVLNDKKVGETKLSSGFLANVTHAIDYTAMKASQEYALRDEPMTRCVPSGALNTRDTQNTLLHSSASKLKGG